MLQHSAPPPDRILVPNRVWQLWADPRQLERWWGPPKYPASVDAHDLRSGGRVEYHMTGPEGDQPRGYLEIDEVQPPQRLVFRDGFANEDATPDTELPVTFGRLLHAFNVEFDEDTPDPDVIAERSAPLIESGELLVLFVGEGPDGFAQLRFRPSLYSAVRDASLDELYVVPERRGSGLGRALLDAAMDHARARGADHIEPNTSKADTAALGLCESSGFTNREGGPGGPRMFYYDATSEARRSTAAAPSPSGPAPPVCAERLIEREARLLVEGRGASWRHTRDKQHSSRAFLRRRPSSASSASLTT